MIASDLAKVIGNVARDGRMFVDGDGGAGIGADVGLNGPVAAA